MAHTHRPLPAEATAVINGTPVKEPTTSNGVVTAKPTPEEATETAIETVLRTLRPEIQHAIHQRETGKLTLEVDFNGGGLCGQWVGRRYKRHG